MTDRPIPTAQDPEADAMGRRIRETAVTIVAPGELRARVAEQRLRADERSRSGGALGGRLRLPAAAAGLAGAVALVLAITGLPGGHAPGPSFDDAAQLALARPTAPAPSLDPTDTRRVRAQVGGVAFPNYAYGWPQWRIAGARTDRVGGRTAVTVTYRGPRGAVGYTIVGGKPLDEPAGARHMSVGGRRLAVVRRGATTFVTWRRGGHTCVLASRTPGAEQQLVRFATWA
jgi:hypothetical protein